MVARFWCRNWGFKLGMEDLQGVGFLSRSHTTTSHTLNPKHFNPKPFDPAQLTNTSVRDAELERDTDMKSRD